MGRVNKHAACAHTVHTSKCSARQAHRHWRLNEFPNKSFYTLAHGAHAGSLCKQRVNSCIIVDIYYILYIQRTTLPSSRAHNMHHITHTHTRWTVWCVFSRGVCDLWMAFDQSAIGKRLCKYISRVRIWAIVNCEAAACAWVSVSVCVWPFAHDV